MGPTIPTVGAGRRRRTNLTGVIEKVEALLRDVATQVVLPRYRKLAQGDIFEKAPGDLVTVADRLSEEALTAGLEALLPGSRVIGEEAVAATPDLLDHVGDAGAVWLVDPIDGTANFAAGRGPFALMVALLRDGEPVASCILDPVAGTAWCAERGAGTWLDGVRVWASAEVPGPDRLRGMLAVRYTPPAVGERITAALGSIGQALEPANCAGWEYPAVIRGERHFAFFWRTFPWDHAPGALLLRESGAVVRYLDGGDYRPAQSRLGILAAGNPDVWHAVRSTLLADVAGT